MQISHEVTGPHGCTNLNGTYTHCGILISFVGHRLTEVVISRTQRTRLRAAMELRTAARFALHPRLYVGKGQPEFLRVAPANRGPSNGKRVNFILRKDPTCELSSDRDDDGTRDTTAPGGGLVAVPHQPPSGSSMKTG
jgi:hypothetical protein